jgi:hypothetical protein
MIFEEVTMALDNVPITDLPLAENVPVIPGTKTPTPSPEQLHEMRMAQASGLGSLSIPVPAGKEPAPLPPRPPAVRSSTTVASSLRGTDSTTVFAAKLMGIPVLTLLTGLGLTGVAGSQPLESVPVLPDGLSGLDGPHLWVGGAFFLLQTLVSLADRWLNARKTDVDQLRAQLIESQEKVDKLQQERADLLRANDALQIRLEVARDKLDDPN